MTFQTGLVARLIGLKEVKYYLKYLDKYLKTKEKALKEYKKYYEMISKNP